MVEGRVFCVVCEEGAWRAKGDGFAGVGDAVLTYDDGSVGQRGGDVVREVGVDGWDDSDEVPGHAADAA